jgi:hypothetical protein
VTRGRVNNPTASEYPRDRHRAFCERAEHTRAPRRPSTKYGASDA